MKVWAPRPATLASAALVALAFPPFDLGFLVWFALVPWLHELHRALGVRAALVQGFWLALGVGTLAAHWLAHALQQFVLLPFPLAVLGLLVFAALGAQPQFVLFAPLFSGLTRAQAQTRSALSLVSLTLGLAFAYTTLDAFTPRIFDVGLGYALHAFEAPRQVADLFGVDGLTCWVVLVNLCIWQALECLRESRRLTKGAVFCGAIAIAVSSAGFVYGELRRGEIARALAASNELVRVAIVQGSVANETRLAWAAGDDRAAEKQLAAYALLTEPIITEARPIDLVVWPEATFPGVFQQPSTKIQRGRANKFDRQMLRLDRPIVFGAYDRRVEEGGPVLFNSLFTITPRYAERGKLGFVQRYHKHHLLPFAESLPGVHVGGWLHRLLPQLGFFGRGPGAASLPITLPDGRSLALGPILCSESLEASHALESTRLGSDVLVNIGSDGWFGEGGGPAFHLAVARFRSIETRRPQLRAANTGISALILPDGTIAARSRFGEATRLEVEVPLATIEPPPVVGWGDGFGRASALVGAVVMTAFATAISRRPT